VHGPTPIARHARCVAVLVVSMIPGALLAQSSVPGPSFEQVISLRSVGGLAISPDGRSVVFGVRTTDWQANRFDNELWIARDGEQPFQLTRTEKGSSGPARWSRDGRWIAFLADRGNKQQVFLIRPSGGEAQAITDHKEGVSNFRWAPDGKRIAFTAVEPDEKDRKERTERYGDYAVEDAEYKMTHLWVVDIVPDLWPSPAEAPCPRSSDTATARGERAKADSAVRGSRCAELPKPRRLTEGTSYTVTGFDWSPDGRSIAFGHQRDPLINSGRTGDISVIDVASKQVRPLVTTPGGDFFAVWSPDSRWIVYSSAGGDTVSNFYTNTQLFRISRDGGQATRIAADIDENVGGLTWTRTGNLYGIAWQGAASRRLVAIDPMGGRSRILPGGPDLIFGADFAADGRTVALSGATPTTLAELYRASVDGSSLARSTAITAMTGQMRDWQLGTSEVVKWKSRDSATIEGVLHKPAGFDPRRKYPLFVVIHGGPTGIDTPTPWTGYVYPVMQWLAKGALVLRPNYRGSAGYGAKFRALNVRNLGVGDAWDVLSGVDHLVAQGIVDTTRMGAMGWSQGGYISAFLTTTTDRFKAISVGAGISNWMTYYVNTDIHPFTRQYLKATPWDDPEI
jgi:dipeptidyl aminopeptidase/acylaminoacyl peptidase